jgi:hypothetical protein
MENAAAVRGGIFYVNPVDGRNSLKTWPNSQNGTLINLNTSKPKPDPLTLI